MESAVRRYGSKTEVGAMRPVADAIRVRAAMPCNAHSALIPCQALRSWIKQKDEPKFVFSFLVPVAGVLLGATFVKGE